MKTTRRGFFGLVAAAPLALKTDQPPKIKLPVVKSDRFCEVCGNGLVRLARIYPIEARMMIRGVLPDC